MNFNLDLLESSEKGDFCPKEISNIFGTRVYLKTIRFVLSILHITTKNLRFFPIRIRPDGLRAHIIKEPESSSLTEYNFNEKQF